MLRKAILTFVTMTAIFIVSAASASAVHVENTGMHEIEGENTIAIGVHAPGFIPVLFCDNEWELDVEEDGHFNIHDVEIHQDHTGDSGLNCESANDCMDAGWEGQIVEGGLGEFTAHITFCLEGTGGHSDGEPKTVECPITNTEAHCDWEIGVTEGGGGIPPGLMEEVVGEVFIHGDGLDLMHAPT